MGIAKEGYRFIVPAAGLLLIFLAAGWSWLALAFGLLSVALMGFFRDPDRHPPKGEGLILSPADGTVVGIGPAGNGVPETKISIFLSPLDVHINRAPIAGKIEEVKYQRGKFLAAYKDQASEANEQNTLKIVDSRGRRSGVVQIAGVLARRIVCYPKPGDSVAQGERFGLIMFGSRVDLFVPEGSHVEAAEGQKVRGGETIIGRFA